MIKPETMLSFSACKWYVNRLLAMSLPEILYRAFKALSNSCDHLFLREIKPDISLIEKGISWYFEIKRPDAVSAFVKDKNLWNEERAGYLLKRMFTFFAFDKKYIGKSIDWHRDYKNDKKAPLAFSNKINYRNYDEVGDIKYIWEINRHQHIISLAKAFYLNGDRKYKNEAIRQINDWIDSNPYKKGVNWASSLELGIRLISWAWAWMFLGSLEKDFREKWLESIYRHCDFISGNYSLYSSANNHLIGEAAGLFIAATVWPFIKKSDQWREKSREILIEEIENQTFQDGVIKEQAVSYHQFILDFFILAGLLGEKNGIAFPASYWKRVEKMIGFLLAIMDKNGNIPDIGDSDDGFVVILNEEYNFNPYKSLLATGAVLFNRGDFKTKAETFDEKSFWLMGPDGWSKFNNLEAGTVKPAKAFHEGGYYILKDCEGTDDEVISIFDCGPLGYQSIAAHGHADALSFTLNIAGKPVLIDPGTYEYHAKKEWREYFKSTSAHNTIRVDSESQSVSGGSFIWIKKAQASLIKYESTEEYDIVAGEHNGYARLRDPVLHAREMIMDKKNAVIKIYDRISAEKRHYIEQFFHFSRECSVTRTGKCQWRVVRGASGILMNIDSKLNTKATMGSVEPIMGWQSWRFDVKAPAYTIINSMEAVGSCELETEIKIIFS
jgi:hypothetical protein